MDLQTFEEGLLLDANDDETVLTVDIVEKRSRFFCTSFYVTLMNNDAKLLLFMEIYHVYSLCKRSS